jgi:deoxyribonuclease-4
MRRIGAHVSIAEHLHCSVDRAIEIGCLGTFQIFTTSPRRWNAAPIKEDDAKEFRNKVSLNNFEPYCHMPYMPNLSSPDQKVHSESTDVLIREIKRCDELGIKYLVLHFGSHSGTSIADGHLRFVGACKRAIGKTGSSEVRLLLENSAGVKNSIGSSFEFVKHVLDEIGNEDRTGVCFDTCHAFAAGYDLRSENSVKETMQMFDSQIGVERLMLFHLNDSKKELAGARDAHEHIGKGKIGLAGFRALLSLAEYSNVPAVLETPIEKEGDEKRNLDMIKSVMQ